MKNLLYKNLETGELMTAREMEKQGAEMYDIDDPTNPLMWSEYYEEIDIDKYVWDKIDRKIPISQAIEQGI